jgi:phosphoribosylglycinamide formyltransferase-1
VTAALNKSPDVAGRRKRLVALSCTLPEVTAEPCGVQHLAFKVRKKIFAYYAYDHHGDGRIALLCKALPGEQVRLLQESPDRYFVPPYVGPKGWVGFRLDTRAVDWKLVKDLTFAAYFLTAPDGVRTQMGRAGSRKREGLRRRRTRG